MQILKLQELQLLNDNSASLLGSLEQNELLKLLNRHLQLQINTMPIMIGS